MSVILKLFGTPQIRFSKRWQALPFEKTSAVLLYVATHGQGVARGELATLLWESDDSRARANLRQLLAIPANYRLRIHAHSADGRMGFHDSRLEVKAGK